VLILWQEMNAQGREEFAFMANNFTSVRGRQQRNPSAAPTQRLKTTHIILQLSVAKKPETLSLTNS
jgi:hypothetical protein